MEKKRGIIEKVLLTILVILILLHSISHLLIFGIPVLNFYGVIQSPYITSLTTTTNIEFYSLLFIVIEWVFILILVIIELSKIARGSNLKTISIPRHIEASSTIKKDMLSFYEKLKENSGLEKETKVRPIREEKIIPRREKDVTEHLDNLRSVEAKQRYPEVQRKPTTEKIETKKQMQHPSLFEEIKQALEKKPEEEEKEPEKETREPEREKIPEIKKEQIAKKLANIKVKLPGSRTKTDIDSLYEMLKEKKIIALNDIAKAFNVPEDLVLEWVKILETADLAVIVYPRFGKPQIKLKEK